MSTAQRLARLERSNRRWRLGAIGSGLALIALLMMGQQIPDNPDLIRTRRLEVVDATGTTVVALSAARKGGQIEVASYRGETAARIVADHDGEGSIQTYRPRGGKLIEITATSGGDGMIRAYDRAGHPRAVWP